MNYHREAADLPGGRILKHCCCAVKDLGHSSLFPSKSAMGCANPYPSTVVRKGRAPRGSDLTEEKLGDYTLTR